MSMMHKFDQQECRVAEKAVDALHDAQQKALATHQVLVVKNDHLVMLSKDGIEKIIKPVKSAISVVCGTKIMRKV